MAAVIEPAHLAKLRDVTTFSLEELQQLQVSFRRIAALHKPNGVIDLVELQRVVGANENSAFLHSLFKMLDQDKSGAIDFYEFGVGLAIYQNKTRAVPEIDRFKLFFKLHDVDGDGEISMRDLDTMLKDTFAASFMIVSDDDIRALVTTTFAKFPLTARGTIDFQGFCSQAHATIV